MQVLLVGAGGREAALAWRLAGSPSVRRLIVTNPWPGAPEGCVVAPARDVPSIVARALEHAVDLVVVGPEAPLVAGVADALAAVGVPCFGPSAAAARLEGSKAFTKEVLAAAGVPTAAAVVCDLATDAGWSAARARAARGAVVVKADGLAAGKGVFVCPTAEEAVAALDTVGRFGDAARVVVLEDLLVGPEVSVFALCDGQRAVPLLVARDHKRVGDGDTGPNTGGMGAVAPVPGVDAAALVDLVCAPVLREMEARGAPFRGVLFAGLMLTAAGPKVLEFNVRFGDPECQALMCLWDDDPAPWLLGAATGALPAGAPRFADAFACCVVLAAPGYPDAPTLGAAIPEAPMPPGARRFVAGAERGSDGKLRVSGGRVLCVAGVGATAAEARARAYAAVPSSRFEGALVRSDIGASTV